MSNALTESRGRSAGRRGGARLAAAAALLTAWGVGCQWRSEPDNVVLVLGDALRARSLPTYGHTRPTAPFIDSVADRGLVFANAYSHYSYTWPTISNLFTGIPYSTLVEEELFVPPTSTVPGGGLVPDNLTLAELLSAAGVVARGVSANPWICNDHGFGQGFDRLHDAEAWVPDFWKGRFRKLTGEEVNQVAARYLEELSAEAKPWFLFLLYFDTHNPYLPPREDRALLVPERYGPSRRVPGGGPRRPDGRALKYRTEELREWFTEEDVGYLRSLYEAEIHHFDRAVRSLFDELERRGLRDSTTVIISADHGESFYERGFWGHGYLSRNEEQRVPLIVVPPGGASRRRIMLSPVTTTDIFHSILSHFGVQPTYATPPLPWLTDVMTGKSRGTVAYTEGPGGAHILRSRRYSFYRYLAIDDPKRPLRHPNGEFLYDLRADPAEVHDLLERAPSEGEAIRQALLDGALYWPADAAASGIDPLEKGDEGILERLRALGYVE